MVLAVALWISLQRERSDSSREGRPLSRRLGRSSCSCLRMSNAPPQAEVHVVHYLNGRRLANGRREKLHSDKTNSERPDSEKRARRHQPGAGMRGHLAELRVRLYPG